MANFYNRIDEYNDNKVAYVWDDGENINMVVCDNMSDFLSLYGHDYKDKGVFYTAKVYTPMFADKVIMSSKDFNRLAETYHRTTGIRAYRAIYAEIAVAKVLHGKHRNPMALHKFGDVIAKGIKYEVKFGKEVTI